MRASSHQLLKKSLKLKLAPGSPSTSPAKENSPSPEKDSAINSVRLTHSEFQESAFRDEEGEEEEEYEVESEKPPFKSRAPRLELARAQHFDYLPSTSHFPLFPPSNRSQFTVIAL